MIFQLSVGNIGFSIDIKLAALPPLPQNDTNSTLEYSNLINTCCHFATNIFKTLIEEHRSIYTTIINNNRDIIVLKEVIVVEAKAVV